LTASATTCCLAAAKGRWCFNFNPLYAYGSTKLKIAAGLVVLAGVGTTLLLQNQAQAKLRADNAPCTNKSKHWLETTSGYFPGESVESQRR